MIANEIRDNLKKVYAILNKHKVDCLLIGGTAVGFYGYQRISGVSMFKPEMKSDLDFWYNPTNKNFIAIVKTLYDLEVDTTDLERIVFNPERTYLKIPMKNFHLDFLPQMKGLSSYSVCKKNARKEIIDGNEISILGLNDLIANKAAIDRDIDRRLESFEEPIQIKKTKLLVLPNNHSKKFIANVR
jgi:hypothetical protein